MKAMFANAAHHDQVFRFGERTVFLTMLNDAVSEAFADARQRFKFFCGSDIDIDSVSRSVVLKL